MAGWPQPLGLSRREKKNLFDDPIAGLLDHQNFFGNILTHSESRAIYFFLNQQNVQFFSTIYCAKNGIG